MPDTTNIRSASAVWHGELATGHGDVTPSTGAFPTQPVTWKARTEAPEGMTSPEELIAAAHAACYAMALSYHLANNGFPPEKLEVTADVAFGPKPGAGPAVHPTHLTVVGTVPGLDQAQFEELAKAGEQNCPVSNALRATGTITVDARLA